MDIILIKERIKEKLIKEIDILSEDELKKIDNNTHEVKIKIEKIRKKDNHNIELTVDMMKVFDKRLSELSSREEGMEYLLSNLKDKLSAEHFAKYMSVSFLKQDNKDYIINKIVEATIGAKLRSLAIKGK
jgi:hypothetical protein